MSFKECSKCGTQWGSRSEFLSDPQTRLLGYQPAPPESNRGFFLFHHGRCGTSLALELPTLESLVSRPMLSLSGCSTGQVPECCLNGPGKEPCPLYCVCAFVDAVRAVLEAWPKARAVPSSPPA